MIGGAGLALQPDVVARLRAQLAEVADRTVDAVTSEVGEYGALEAQVGENIRQAVQLALATFLRLAAQPAQSDDGEDAMQPALEGAYALGRGEARSGRTMDALLAAYRVGARTSWRHWSATAVDGGLPADTVARFAELVFAYIDELSAASAAGHTDELARTGRVRQQQLERLGVALLAGEPGEALQARADAADWRPAATLTAVVLPAAHVRASLALVDGRSLVVTEDVAADVVPEATAVLLVPDVDRTRAGLVRDLHGRAAVVGPARPWTSVRASYLRALRLLDLLGRPDGSALDTEQHLPALVLGADAEALADLRAAALAPLAGVRPAAAQRLVETLRAWLLHHGRRDDVARSLHVHPQTIRYRMTQLRELFGDRLTDPQEVLRLTLALAASPHPGPLGTTPQP
ncbi:MAG TPA: helix-turn-helix domain-containing protein [Mycobacteriales bacterium]|nr:helix-turn-helix domain-containing protein [Mycobacteriales bacterium]